MRLPLTALTLTLLLGACSQAHSDACPPVVKYPRAMQKQAAEELKTCNCPVIVEFLKDYKVMRDQSRSCR